MTADAPLTGIPARLADRVLLAGPDGLIGLSKREWLVLREEMAHRPLPGGDSSKITHTMPPPMQSGGVRKLLGADFIVTDMPPPASRPQPRALRTPRPPTPAPATMGTANHDR